jgi:predicted transcriptional regulator
MPSAKLSPAQWQLMRICWDLGGEVSVREVREEYIRRYANLRDHRTVGTLLNQCEQRGYLKSRLEGGAKLYHPVVNRADTARVQCARFLDELADDRLELEILQQMAGERLERKRPRRRSVGGAGR